MAMPMDNSATPNETPTADKGAEAVAQTLAKWYMTCHSEEPGSPKCQAIMSLMQAVAEIGGGQAGGDQFDPDAAAEGDPAMMQPGGPDMGAPPPQDGGLPPEDMALAEQAGPPPTSLADASGQTNDMMAAAARRRKP